MEYEKCDIMKKTKTSLIMEPKSTKEVANTKYKDIKAYYKQEVLRY
jgi:phage-related protein